MSLRLRMSATSCSMLRQVAGYGLPVMGYRLWEKMQINLAKIRKIAVLFLIICINAKKVVPLQAFTWNVKTKYEN